MFLFEGSSFLLEFGLHGGEFGMHFFEKLAGVFKLDVDLVPIIVIAGNVFCFHGVIVIWASIRKSGKESVKHLTFMTFTLRPKMPFCLVAEAESALKGSLDLHIHYVNSKPCSRSCS